MYLKVADFDLIIKYSTGMLKNLYKLDYLQV